MDALRQPEAQLLPDAVLALLDDLLARQETELTRLAAQRAEKEAALDALQQTLGRAQQAQKLQQELAAKRAKAQPVAHSGGCPGSRAMELHRQPTPQPAAVSAGGSELRQWPVQIKLAPLRAPYFDGAKLLIAADCTAYAYATFHQDFIRGHITLVGCPKLDGVDYAEKLTEILRQNDIQSVHIVRMEVPCCGGLELAAKKALQDSGKFIPWQVTVISTEGTIVER